MQESQQLQLGNHMGVLDLMDDEVRVCDTCASACVGLDSKLIVCHKCHDGAEHLYCMQDDEMEKLIDNEEAQQNWTCQECMPREGTNKLVQDEVEVAAIKKGCLSERSTNCESSKGSKLKSRSSCAGKSGENGAQLTAKRHQVPSAPTSPKRARVLTIAESSQPIKPCNNSSLGEDFLNKKLKMKSVNKMVYSVPERSSGETLFSGPSFCNIDAVESSGQLGHRLQASNHNTHKDPNCPNEKKKNESQQGEQPTNAATAMSIYKLIMDPASDERTHLRDLVQLLAAFLSQHVIPEARFSWLGKFQIHNIEGITRTWDGIQAHFSSCSCESTNVVEVVKRLPEIIVLEELPRLRIWPSQFMESQVTEKDIALYFFAQDLDSYRGYKQLVDYMMENDLALKGKLGGVELLIFPSNILPKKSQRWNGMFLLWGVFRGRKPNNSASTPVSNFFKLENGNAGKSLPFDLNAYPQDGDDMEIVDEIPEFEGIGGSGLSGDRVLLVGESSNSLEANAERADIDVNVSLWPENETPENGSVGIEDNDVEVASTSLSLAPPSTVTDPIGLEIAHALMFLSGGKAN